MPRDEALIRQLYVKIAGTELDVEIMNDLYVVEVDTSLHLPDMCVLKVHDDNAELTNNGPFDLGAEIKIGVSDEQGRGDHDIFVGEITGIEPAFQAGTVVDLVIRGYDKSHRLHRGIQTKAYVNMSDSDIASDIARSVGLQADVDSSSTTHDHVYQDGQTHMAFLRDRARRIGYNLYVTEGTLHFKEAGADSETLSLEWGDQLRSFSPILTLGDQLSEVKVKGWDPTTKREIIGQADTGQTAPSIGEPDSGGETAESAFGAAEGLAVRTTVSSQAEADTVAQALLNEHDGSFVEAEGTCYGQPDLRAGVTVEISSLGTRFNGSYKVTSATHVWDTSGDYLTHFRVSGRRADTLGELLVGESRGPDRWHPMIGVVTNNNDPDDMGRVKIKFPWLDADIESDWARVVGPGAGSQRGIYWLPEVNDEVLVVFVEGEMASPLVIGGLWNGIDSPAAAIGSVVSNGNVVQRLLVSRTGHRLLFSDENSALIRLESAGGHIILLDDDASKIEIAASGGNTIVLDDGGREIKIEGTGEISIEAGMNLSIKASGNMDLEAGGNLTIKGAVVQLNP